MNGTVKEKIIKTLYLNKIKYLITVNEGILKKLSQKAKPIHSIVIHNASLTNLFPENNGIIKINSNVQLVHEGSLTFNRGLKTLLNSILKLKKNYPKINLKIIGDSPNNERKYIFNFIEKHKLQENITLIGWVNYEDVHLYLKNCDIGLILYKPTKNNLYSTSNKLFNYIASGLSIISLEYLEETNKILKPLHNSKILKKQSSNELYSIINELIKNPTSLLKMKNNSILAYKNHNWEIEEKKLFDFYKKVIKD
jgi:glycosyltransferase involved in cell wall biosynthesis